MANNSNISRYHNQPVNVINGNTFYLEDDYVIPEKESDLVTYVKEEEVHRLDKLAYRVYKNPLLSWVIARRNRLESMDDLWFGREIKYPPLADIYNNGGIINN